MTKELQIRKQFVRCVYTPVSQIEWRHLFSNLARVTVSLKHFENASSFAPKYAAALTAASGRKSEISAQQNKNIDRIILRLILDQFDCNVNIIKVKSCVLNRVIFLSLEKCVLNFIYESN